MEPRASSVSALNRLIIARSMERSSAGGWIKLPSNTVPGKKRPRRPDLEVYISDHAHVPAAREPGRSGRSPPPGQPADDGHHPLRCLWWKPGTGEGLG